MYFLFKLFDMTNTLLSRVSHEGAESQACVFRKLAKYFRQVSRDFQDVTACSFIPRKVQWSVSRELVQFVTH